MNVYVTIGGQGSRLKTLSSVDKQLLYLGDKRIIEHILDVFPQAKLLGDKKTNSRKETLQAIAGQTDCLIIDCDVVPNGCDVSKLTHDTIFCFSSDKQKYGSIVLQNGYVTNVDERNSISKTKCSGAYFVKSIDRLLQAMTNDNSIASGMIGAHAVYEDTFIRVGDVEDYYEAL